MIDYGNGLDLAFPLKCSERKMWLSCPHERSAAAARSSRDRHPSAARPAGVLPNRRGAVINGRGGSACSLSNHRLATESKFESHIAFRISAARRLTHARELWASTNVLGIKRSHHQAVPLLLQAGFAIHCSRSSHLARRQNCRRRSIWRQSSDAG